jgi:hypothetical protein
VADSQIHGGKAHPMPLDHHELIEVAVDSGVEKQT